MSRKDHIGLNKVYQKYEIYLNTICFSNIDEFYFFLIFILMKTNKYNEDELVMVVGLRPVSN